MQKEDWRGDLRLAVGRRDRSPIDGGCVFRIVVAEMVALVPRHPGRSGMEALDVDGCCRGIVHGVSGDTVLAGREQQRKATMRNDGRRS